MQKTLSALTLFLSLSIAGWSSPCPTGQTLNFYITNFNNPTGCTIGNLVYNNFSYIGAGVLAPAVLASGVTVVPLTSVHDFGFDFQANWSVSPVLVAPASQTSTIGYTAREMFNLSEIKDLDLGFVGSRTGGLTPLGGTIAIDETVCLNGLILGGCLGGIQTTLGVFANSLGVQLDATLLINPQVSQIDVLKVLVIDSGTSGSASVSSFSNTTDSVPEPMTLSLIGTGLLGLGIMKKRRRQRS
ncbi:MAG: PEP-CTERM sorting domain-containing protein [Bryobacteraceae bacterium]